MGKIISKLAIIATIATLASNAMAYTIISEKTTQDKIEVFGSCDNGRYFVVFRYFKIDVWYGFDGVMEQSREVAIRKTCDKLR